MAIKSLDLVERYTYIWVYMLISKPI